MTTNERSELYYINLDISTECDLKLLSVYKGVSIEELLEAAAMRYAEVEWSNINRREREKKKRQIKKNERTIEKIRMKIIIRDFMNNIKPKLEQESDKKGK